VTRDLTKVFKEKVAVDELNLTVSRGEIFGLVGPDGSGKTTTIRLLAAIMDPTAGDAHVAGFNTQNQSEQIKQRIGYMAQRFNLYRDLSVWENINFYADVYEVSGDERRRRIDRLLQFARLDEFKDRRAAQLSGGMQKKLALACTLVHTPEIIFLDEPTTGVDPVSRREFWEILTDLHIQGVTLFISTPYMEEAERCSRVGLLYNGRMMLCDSPGELKKQVIGELIALWPSDLRKARELLESIESILQIQTYGRQLRLITLDPAKTAIEVQQTLESGGLTVLDMRQTAPRMEEAFISIVSQVAAEEASR
jgi:ABC-2 type transport system ATP-binding protein